MSRYVRQSFHIVFPPIFLLESKSFASCAITPGGSSADGAAGISSWSSGSPDQQWAAASMAIRDFGQWYALILFFSKDKTDVNFISAVAATTIYIYLPDFWG